MSKKCESVNIVCKSLLETLILKSHTCFLWNYVMNTGIFSPFNEDQKDNNNPYGTEYIESLVHIRGGMNIYRENIINKMKEFIRIKDELMEEALNFSKYMESVVLARIPSLVILKSIIQNVSDP